MKIVFFLLIVSLFAGCSSTSYSTRYGNQIPEEKTEKRSSVRFTGDDYEEESEAEESFQNPGQTESGESLFDEIKELYPYLNNREKLLLEITKFMDAPYLYGGESISGTDCSGFTSTVYYEALSLKIPRTASQQFKFGNSVSSIDDLKFGDLVFFDTQQPSYPGHVGIFIGGDRFVHSGTKTGVTVSSLKTNYFSSKYVGARRVIN